jgi:hypothetical protein
MALNYGYQTPLSIFVSHAAFGAILGWLYRVVGQYDFHREHKPK